MADSVENKKARIQASAQVHGAYLEPGQMRLLIAFGGMVGDQVEPLKQDVDELKQTVKKV